MSNITIDPFRFNVPPIGGCMDPIALNFNPLATFSSGPCIYGCNPCRSGPPFPITAGCCQNTLSSNYNPFATCDDGSCCIDGCTNPLACNFDPLATCDNGSCLPPDGCTNPIACNYDPTAVCDDGSCILPDGCTDVTACNYDPLATCDDGSCIGLLGCIDPTALNFNIAATCDDGTCIYPCALYMATASSTNIPCNGLLNGTATALVTGSNGNDSYLWSNGQTTPTVTGLAPGIYTCTVTDTVYGCTSTVSVTIIQPAQLLVSLEVKDVFPGQTNGAVLATVTGGTAPYTYLWDDASAQTTNPATGLSLGPIGVTVTDCNGCTATDSAFVLINIVGGCTDPLSPNYSFAANDDDGSCYIPLPSLTYIPDANFRTALENLGIVLTTDWVSPDGTSNPFGEYVLTTVLNTVTFLDVDNLNIADLTGIEAFTALTGLVCSNNQLTSLDVSQNIALTYLDCFGNQLTTLDVSQNTALTYLDCGVNQLSSLDVRNGNNTNLYLDSTGNPNLTCIDVDAIAYPTANWLNISSQHFFSINCASFCLPVGCTDPNADNYNPTAIVDDGSCTYCNNASVQIIIPQTITLNNPALTLLIGGGFWTIGTYSMIYNGIPVAVGQVTVTVLYNGISYNQGDIVPFVPCVTPPVATINYTGVGCIVTTFPTMSYGCTDPTASNYNPGVMCSSNTCVWLGCTDPAAINYDALATVDDGSCIAPIIGCMDPTACDYDPLANVAGPCTLLAASITSTTDAGCDGSSGTATATISTGISCAVPTNYTISWSLACNNQVMQYRIGGFGNPWTLVNPAVSPHTFIGLMPGTVYQWRAKCQGTPFAGIPINTFTVPGASGYSYLWSNGDTTQTATNLLPGNHIVTITGCTCTVVVTATILACSTCVYGCTDPTQTNYNALANCDDGSCIPITYGCTDPTASNYNPVATNNDGSCEWFGCTDPTALNYDATATIDDGSCIATIPGCIDPTACNFNALATIDDGTCSYTVNTTDNISICAGDSYFWPANGVNYNSTQSGLIAVTGVCTTSTLNLTITPLTTSGSVTTSICAGGSYTWLANGQTYTTAQSGVTVVTGCNTATLNLTVNPATTTGSVTTSICNGQSYTWPANGQTYTTTQTNLTYASGCNIATLNLTVTSLTTTGSVTTSICPAGSYTWPANGVTYTTAQSGVTVVSGCNTATLNLTITPQTTIGSVTTSICAGDSYTWPVNGVTYTTASSTAIATGGCNTATLNLTVTPPTTTGSVNTSICVGGSYTWPANGQTYTSAQSGITHVSGCNTATLNLTVTPQPAQPAVLCYETATFNTVTCVWDVTGTQPVQPTLDCWETATFNNTTCAWVVTGTPPDAPTFTAVGPYCSGATIPPLPTTSNNGVTGTWSPAIDNTATTTYTFTPTAGLCAFTQTLTITINPLPIISLTNNGSSITTVNVFLTGTLQLYGTATAATTNAWVSATPANATINVTTGLVTGVALGTSIITYTNSLGCTANIQITIVSPPPAPNATECWHDWQLDPGNAGTYTQVGAEVSLALYTPGNVPTGPLYLANGTVNHANENANSGVRHLCNGAAPTNNHQTLQLTVKATNLVTGVVTTNPPGEWTSSNNETTVSQTGLVARVSSQINTSEIRFTLWNNATGTAPLNPSELCRVKTAIYAKELRLRMGTGSLTLGCSNSNSCWQDQSMSVGQTRQVYIRSTHGYPSGGSGSTPALGPASADGVVKNTGTWSVYSGSSATVTTTGLVTAVSSGTTRLRWCGALTPGSNGNTGSGCDQCQKTSLGSGAVVGFRIIVT